ncbi:heme-binding protein 2 [Trichomycterus rosablanca]|uniref:heme-binding protein 2 n=1 Tax=Trichomycterus rosablanca TaxID=2290929 RepID=UPI002F35C48C
MFLLSWIMTVVLVVQVEAGVGPSNSTSSYCTESRECLLYDQVCRTDEYEVRHYSPTRWVSTDAEAYLMGVGAAMAFRRLHQYISGSNREGIDMQMTAPVLVLVPEETRMWEPALYTLSFLLPSTYQQLPPPAPTNDKVYFTEMPEMDVYVRTFGGWMLSLSSRLHRQMLIKELQRVNANYNRTYHYAVGYDSPLKLLNRHNELWYVVEGEPVCGGATKGTADDPAATANPVANATATTAPPGGGKTADEPAAR